MLGPDDALNLAPAPVLLIDQTFGKQDMLVRERAAVALDRMRRAGATTLLVSHEEDLIRRLADEVWWIHKGKLAGRGDPEEVLGAYRKHIAGKLRAWGETVTPPLAPTVRRGDGRAEILRVETIGENGKPTMVWRSGELAVVQGGGAFPRGGGGPGGGDYDPHAHRAQRVRHEYRAGKVEAGSVRCRGRRWNSRSRSGASCVRGNTP